MKKIIYQVRGLSCNACVNRVKNALQPYAEEVNVSLKPPEAILQNPSVDLTTLNAALKPIGHYQLIENRKLLEKDISWPKWLLTLFLTVIVIFTIRMMLRIPF